MKNRFNLIAWLTCVGLAAGSLSCLPIALAQDAPQVTSRPGAEDEDRMPGSMAGVGQKPTKAELEQKKKEKEAKAAGGTTLSSQDKDFMMQAAKDGMKEVHMGQMAQKQGQSDEVKRLGGMIASDHTKANNELMALAKKKSVTLDTKHKMDKLDKDNFDQAWLAMMVKDHQQDIAAFEKQAKNGTDADVKSFASKTAPVLKKHLKAVQDAQKKMAKKSG